jgi:hypothetical protein
MSKNQHIPASELEMRAFADPEQYTDTVKEATRDGDGWSVQMENGWHIYAAPAIDGHTPQPGDTITLWGRGIGYVVRGVAIDDVVYRYESDEDYQTRSRREQDERDAKKRSEYEQAKRDNDARIDKLPRVFQKRIDGFRERRADFGWQHEGYELFTCEQAAAFAEAFPDGDALTAFNEMTYEQQRAACPAMDDGHSGNTFGSAVYLARLYLDHPYMVPKAHGALCPLVGCDDYGCFAATEEAKAQR